VFKDGLAGEREKGRENPKSERLCFDRGRKGEVLGERKKFRESREGGEFERRSTCVLQPNFDWRMVDREKKRERISKEGGGKLKTGET